MKNVFNKIIQFHFGFIEQYGFKDIDCNEDNSAIYSNGKCDIILLFDVIGYEITCDFKIVNSTSFSLTEALNYAQIKNLYGVYQVGNENDLEKGVEYLSNTLFTLFNVIDFSDRSVLLKLSNFVEWIRKKDLEQYYFDNDMKLIEAYWKDHRYYEAQCLLEKHSKYLTKTQAKKLQYIRKQVKSINK